jgi:Site-specific recombinases, DNA invertase Pin homologs
MELTQYLCGSYTRLSKEDKDDTGALDESSSISSQKLIITSFAKFNNLNVVKEYVDDGYSGGNFERPAFKEMISDIESGKINCIITKDLSRLGREMYRTGKYIEEYFLEKGIRYIAINDSYDSNIGDSMLGIRLSVNDLYLRDVSKKVRTSFRAKQEKGDYIGSLPRYGYIKNPENSHQLIVDEEVREIVEYIYDMAEAEYSPAKIAEMLTLKKVPIPIVHKKDPRGLNVIENDGFGIWKRQTIKDILTSKMYIGYMVQNTFNKVSYNSKKLRKIPESQQIVVKDTHEAIVSVEKYNKVQKILISRTKNITEINVDKHLLSGLLKCKECGRTLRISESKKKKGIVRYTQCNLYTRKGKFGVCSSHRLCYDLLEEDVLAFLKEICEKFCEHYNFTKIENNSANVVASDITVINDKIAVIDKRVSKNNGIIEKLYLDRLNEVISEQTYINMAEKYENENKNYLNDKKLFVEKKQILLSESRNGKFDKCLKTVKDYMSLKAPTINEIKRLVKYIEIDKAKNVFVRLNFKLLNV